MSAAGVVDFTFMEIMEEGGKTNISIPYPYPSLSLTGSSQT
jgi:hypothetical protein